MDEPNKGDRPQADEPNKGDPWYSRGSHVARSAHQES